MKRNTLRLIIILATICIVGITVTQVYWMRKAFDIKEKEFNVNVSLGLKMVANGILKHNHKPAANNDPVNRLSYKYYVVDVNDDIPPPLLDSLLRAEFIKRGLTLNFGFVIYEGDRLVYGKCVSFNNSDTNARVLGTLPRWADKSSYFGVYFPSKDNAIFSELGIWTFSSVVLLFVLLFFCYALFVILRQKRLSEVQKDFVNNMAHEFNTPISAILISAEVLQKPDIIKTPERMQHYVSIVEGEAKRLQTQVEKVLQMTATDKEQISLHQEEIQVHELLVKAAEHVKLAELRKNAEIHFELVATDPFIMADRIHITNVFYNLIDNAIKYSGQDPVIHISTKNEKKGITVCVADNGIGISADDGRKIFDKFYRVPQGNVHNVNGFGLGLNYVKRMVKAHYGSVVIESELGKGSKFFIYLPKNPTL